ncbi:protein SLX4IP-like [Carassius auratus]|uniref:Protein SLX4IP-like n=1 Tax=Carassius auratus TaxID=7957 RepID=A0A6P6QLB9_CARAU|nr:protein SLX4IP-like [Carassius auratus]
MQSSKFVVKCGNFAVLVDLHILPLGGQDNASWFSPEHRKEVGSLIREALELRVRQFQETKYQKIQPKLRKDLTLTTPLSLEGGNVRLAVHFMKRHVNLRCIVRQHYRELRVFPERVVVCASPPENSALPIGNLNLDVSEPSHSKYFSSSVEITDPLPRTATKRAILQKIARQASIQPQQHQDDQESRSAQFQGDKTEKGSAETCHPVTISSGSFLTGESLEEGKAVLSSKLSNSKEVTEPHLDATSSRKQPWTQSSSGEHADHQKTKRLRLGEPAASSDSNNPSSDIATPDSVCSPQTEISQTNQSGLAANLKGLSVKPVSSGSSISSRLVAREGKKGGELRTSRLRRLKKP